MDAGPFGAVGKMGRGMIVPTMGNCTLQINVAASDWRHLQHILPHQLRQLRAQVDHVLVVADLQAPSGRYARSAGRSDSEEVVALLEQIRAADSRCVIRAVDTTVEMRTTLARRFLGGVMPPLRDGHGGPYHAYLQGLLQAPTDAILHLDADMLLGGGSMTWVAEAMAALNDQPGVLMCAPLPGPPAPHGVLPPQAIAAHARAQRYGSMPRRIDGQIAYRFRHASTRAFLIRRDRLEATELAIVKMRSGVADRHARRMAAPLEVALSALMRRDGLERLDMLGEMPGMWTLHPHARTPAFYQGLSKLIYRVEHGLVPDDQRGHFDLRRSFLDWGADPPPFDSRPRWRRNLSLALRRTPLRAALERRAQRFG